MGRALTLSVQIYTKDDQGTWVWVPANPEQSRKALKYRLEVGQTTFLGIQGQKLAGSKIRFWAEWEGGAYTEYQDRDLWLVPEVDPAGNHVYSAPEIETYPLDLRP